MEYNVFLDDVGGLWVRVRVRVRVGVGVTTESLDVLHCYKDCRTWKSENVPLIINNFILFINLSHYKMEKLVYLTLTLKMFFRI